MKKHLYFWFCALIISCGGSDPAGSIDALTDEYEEEVLNPDAIEIPETPYVETEVSTNYPIAGEGFTVTCTGKMIDFDKLEVVVQSESGSLEGVFVNDNAVTITKTGGYSVACKETVMGLIDETPEKVFVSPAQPQIIETTVQPHQIKAGETITYSCLIKDKYGNDITTEAYLFIDPAEGTKVTGNKAQLTKVGNYKVACTTADGTVIDLTPEHVSVVVNVPKKIFTFVTPDIVKAGYEAEVDCKVTDAWDNEVKDFPLSIFLPKVFTLSGKKVSSIVTGVYSIKCVPENIEWKYFDLYPATIHVLPGDPSLLVLKVVPKKNFYGVNETITVTYTVYDKYNNSIPDLPLAPVSINPPVGITPSPDAPTKKFKLKAEGVYLMTFRLLDYPDISATVEIKVDGTGPLLTITYPERGATLTGKQSVTVAGYINEEVTGLKEFKINGEDVLNIKPDGLFTHIIKANQGLNIIVAEAKDNAGFKVRTTRAFYFSIKYYPVDTTNPKKGFVPDAIQVYLSKDFIDDGDHNPNKPDDLATILEKYIDTLDLGSLIPSPAASQSGYDVYIKNVTYGKSHVTLEPIEGGINVFARIPDFRADVKLDGKCFLCPDFSGDVSASEINFNGTIYIWLDANKQVHAEMANVKVQIFDLDVDVDGILGWLLDWLIDIIVDEFASDIEETLEDQIKEMFADTIKDMLKMLSLKQDLEIPELAPGMQPTSLFIMTEPSKLQFYSGGLDLWMDGTIYGAKKIHHTILGSIGRSQCLNINEGKFALKKKHEVEFAGWFDLINQALYSTWAANVLNMTITEEMLGDSTSIEEYGITDLNVTLDFYLPPILTDCNPESIVTLQVGDLYVDAKLKMFDVPITIGAFVSMELTAEFGIVINEEGNQALSISVKELKTIEIEVVSVNEELKGSEAALEQLIKDLLLPELLETLEESASFSFELPELDMSSLDESLPSGIVLKLNLQTLYKDKGYLAGGGYLE